MNSMKRWYMVGLLVVLFIALTTTVFAFGQRGGGMGHGGSGGPGLCSGGQGGLYGFAANLNLTKEQAEKMWQIKEKFHNDTQSMRYELFQKKFELRKLYADPNTDETTILSKQKEISTLQQKLQDKMAQLRLEQRKILTPEQMKKLNELPAGRGFGPHRMGFGGGGPGRW